VANSTTDVGEVTAPDGPPVAEPARWRRLRAALPALVLYAAIRLVSVAVYATLVAVRHVHGKALFTYYDGGWYRLLATYGYDTRAAARFYGSPFAFFPLYPGLMRAGHDVTGLSVDVVGLVVTDLAALAAAWAIYLIGTLLRGRRVGLLLVALWAVAPAAIMEQMLYADTLAIALSAWSLYALSRRRWLWAGALCLLAGLTRPTVTAVVAAIVVAAALAVRRREDGWRPWVGAALSPLGFLAFCGYVAYRTHRIDGYYWVQRHLWNKWFDGGRHTLRQVWDVLTGSSAYLHNPSSYVTTILVIAVPVLIICQIVQRQPVPLIVYTLVLCVTTLGSVDIYTTDQRELLAAFPLLLPLATALARLRSRPVLIAIVALLAIASGWYAAYVPVMTGSII
jgi:hypothetical protein